ncbi:MAG: hypothetical protein KDA92_22190, partial [Planctomycetales bacterium]|nr:hypothetical protein [Planctomycetales bacterium]
TNRSIYLDPQPGQRPDDNERIPGRPTNPARPDANVRPQVLPLQLRVLVSFPKPAKPGQPAGETTVAASGANLAITQNGKVVYSGRADNNGYLGTNLPQGNYVVQITHGNIRHSEPVSLVDQRVRKTITIQSNAALLAPDRVQ